MGTTRRWWWTELSEYVIAYLVEIDYTFVIQFNYRYGFSMHALTISPKFQVVIPKRIRENLDIKAGEKIQMFQFGNRIELVRVKDIKSMRGFLKGIDTHVEREKDRL